jgi:hypothetical protein
MHGKHERHFEVMGGRLWDGGWIDGSRSSGRLG